jgi:hypothetical protein
LNFKPIIFITIVILLLATSLNLIPVEAKSNAEPFAAIPSNASLHGINLIRFDKSADVAIEAEPFNAKTGERIMKNNILLNNNLLAEQIQNNDLSGIWTISSIENTRVSDISCGDGSHNFYDSQADYAAITMFPLVLRMGDFVPDNDSSSLTWYPNQTRWGDFIAGRDPEISTLDVMSSAGSALIAPGGISLQMEYMETESPPYSFDKDKEGDAILWYQFTGFYNLTASFSEVEQLSSQNAGGSSWKLSNGKATTNVDLTLVIMQFGPDATLDFEKEYVACTGVMTYDAEVYIQNSNAPLSTTATPEPTPGLACSPIVSGLSPSKPGDLISPSAIYIDMNGKDVGVDQERWYINGKRANSTTWDGKPVTVELEWTCLDQSKFSETFNIAAYQGDPITSTGESDPKEPNGITPLGIVAIASGILGVLGIIGVGIGFALKGKSPLPASSVPSSADAPAISTPPLPVVNTPPSLPIPPPPPSTTPPPLVISSPPPPPVIQEPVEPPPPQPAKLTPERRAELTNLRGEMEEEVKRLKTQWRTNRNAAEKLTELKKKNLIKFIFKKGFDVQNWVMNSPVEVINKIAIDPVMDKAFEKHDTSQDANIVVEINNRILKLKNEMKPLSDEVKYLQSEIAKIHRLLG